MKNNTRSLLLLISITILLSCSKEKESVFNMAIIPEGEFIMGSKEGTADEGPVRKVRLKSFFIDKYTITTDQYKKFIDAEKLPPPKSWMFTGYKTTFKNHPVTFVDYKEAETYCKWAGKRLPTEEEWEKAARGSDGRKYPWGNKFDSSKANTSLSGIIATTAVNSFETGKSPYGLYNMAGNVWEWTSSNGINPNTKIAKGGSWGLSHKYSRAFSRVEYNTNSKANNIGFRCAKNR